MTREEAIYEWLDIHCRKCIHNKDRGTGFLNCPVECEVQKDTGIACIHYEEYMADSEEEMEEYINKEEVLKLIRNWWKTTVYANREPVVIEAINELPTIKVEDVYCPHCGAKLGREVAE